MNGAVFRSAPRKGAHVVAYGPLPGNIRDAEGRLILEFQYGPKPATPEKDFPE